MLGRKGQTGAWEGIIILVLLVVVGGLVYFTFTRKTDTQVFQSGAQSISPIVTPHFGGCAITKEYVYAVPDKATH